MPFPCRAPAAALLALILSACATTVAPRDPAAQFFARVSALCGQAFAGRVVSITNVWAREIAPGAVFAYELRRPGRFLRVEFDLSRPVAPPPPPWGAG